MYTYYIDEIMNFGGNFKDINRSINNTSKIKTDEVTIFHNIEQSDDFISIDSLAIGIMLVNASMGYSPLTNLRLNAYMYLAQAYSVVYKGKPLFDYIIDANPRGPTVRPIYLKYQDFSDKPILIPKNISEPEELPGFTENEHDILSDIVMQFGGKTDKDIRLIIQKMNGPWDIARNTRRKYENNEVPLSTLPVINSEYGIIASKHPIISLESLRVYFTKSENRFTTMQDRLYGIMMTGDKGRASKSQRKQKQLMH